MVFYGQVIVGPPGSGKTTYCNGMQQYLRLIGRECFVVNLDPANEYYDPNETNPSSSSSEPDSETNKDPESNLETPKLPYDTIYNVCEEMISLSAVMNQLSLGPNGGLLYCMEYIHQHIEVLISTLQSRVAERVRSGSMHQNPYILFDFPGQAELFTHCTCVKDLIGSIVKAMDFRLCAVQLIDAHFCVEAEKFISAALLSTSTMIRLELPMVNVLSKVDLLQQNQLSGSLPFSLEFFTDMWDLGRLVDYIDSDPYEGEDVGYSNESQFHYADDEEYQRVRNKTRNTPFHKKHRKLHESVCELVDDFGLLNFIPLDIQDATSVSRVVARIDKCNGFVFTNGSNMMEGNEKMVHDLFRCAVQTDEGEWNFEKLASVQENFTHLYQETIPELNIEKEKHSNEKDGVDTKTLSE